MLILTCNIERNPSLTLENTPYFMYRECCVCGLFLGTVPTTIPENNMKITHTYCDWCFEEAVAEVKKG
jgi:hypothetical protein